MIHRSRQPDLRLLESLNTTHRVCVSTVVLIAGVILAGWLVPAFGKLLPQGWNVMKANTALCMLMASASLAMSQPRRSDRQLLGSRVFALLVLLVAGSALSEHLSGLVTGIDVLLVGDPASLTPGRMSLQTGTYLSVLSLVLMSIRSCHRIGATVVDFLVTGLIALTLVMFAGYCFGATQLFGQSTFTRTSPQTLLCMTLLLIVTFGRRAEYGYFSVAIGTGIGSRIVRVMMPFCLLVPFLVVTGTVYAQRAGWLSAPYASALSSSIITILLFLLGIAIAWRINDLERGLRDMSLTDELTRTYNRRGLALLGEQALREARRSELPLTVLFFDLDGLKRVNDSFGHEAGSLFVLDVSDLLRAQFVGADIVARVGGDEFAVVSHTDSAAARAARLRIDAAAEAINRAASRQYPVRYSVGEATFDPLSRETFNELINRADAMMYEQKRAKNAARQVA